MGQQLTRELESQGVGGGAKTEEQQPKATQLGSAGTGDPDPRSSHDLSSSVNSTLPHEQQQDERNTIRDRMREEIKNGIQRLSPSFLMDAMMETIAEKLLQKSSLLLSSEAQQDSSLVPVLTENYFQLGEPNKQTGHSIVIYTKIGPWKHAERSFPRNLSPDRLKVSVTLSIHGNEFCTREFPFVISTELFLKLPLISNYAHLRQFLEHFCMQIQILLMAGQPYELKPLLSFEIPYNTLLKQKASLLMQKFSIENDPVAHSLDCLIYLETEQLAVVGPSRAIKYVRSTSNEDNYLTKMCEELKTSPKLVDLGLSEESPEMPTDLRVTKKFDSDPETSGLKALEAVSTKEFTDHAIQCTPSSSDVATQTDVFFITETRKRMAGFSRESYLKNKLARFQATTSLNSALSVPVSSPPPSEPLRTVEVMELATETVASIQKSGQNEPSGPKQAPKTVFVPRKKSATADTKTSDETQQKDCFKCPEKGCSQEFWNAGALRRHRKYEHK